jgi:hypothetical protein
MKTKVSYLAVLFAMTASTLPADFSYEQNSRITGGMIAGAMKVAAVFSKQAREPIHALVAVKGDRMVHLSSTHGSIIDLDKETITSVDFQKKTWSVMTFAEMEQAMKQMAAKMKEKQSDADMKFKVSVNPTGQTKDISGLNTKEMIMKLEMEMTDQKNGQQGSMIITTDMWLAPKVAGYDEVQQFYRKMSGKISWMPGQMGMGRPDVAKGMSEVTKEVGKLDGMPVYETVRMGGDGTQGQAAAPGEQPKQQAQQEKPSAGAALGSALGGRFGLGRKKKPAEEQQQAPPPDAQQQGQGNAGLLLEMVTETSNFSAVPVDPAKFEMPAGFKQVKPEMRGGGR